MVGMVRSWRRLKDVHVRLFSGLFLWLCSPRGRSWWLESFCVKVPLFTPRTCIYCFFRESDALVLRATRWHHETLNVRLPAEPVGEPRCGETSVGRAISSLPGGTEWEREQTGAATQPLVLRILCWLSIWDAAIALPVVLLFLVLLFADQKLLWRPAELPALNFSVCWLHHDGRQTILELTAAVKV